MRNPLARKTISSIEAALENDKTTAIGDIIKIIQELAAKAFSISISELSQLISRDPTITEKVISAANTLGFNPSGTPIHTISDAIHTVGFEKIRNLAISLMLAENAGANLNTFEQREIAALSVCSGMIAERLGKENNCSINSELLFVCSSLRNYGKLLMSTFLVEQYREARSLALEMPDDEAFNAVFGLTPLALGRYLLESSNLPKIIMTSLREVTGETLGRSATSTDDEILLVAEFAVSISSIAYDDSIGPEKFNSALNNIIHRFSKSFPVSLETINQTIVDVEEDLSRLNRIIGVSDTDAASSSKLRARINGDLLPQPPPGSRVLPQIKAKPLSEMSPEERLAHSLDSYKDAADTIASKLVPGEKVVLKEIYESVLKAISTALELESSMIFLREEFEPRCLSARYGNGPLFNRIKNRPVVSPEKKDVFSICLARREDILIQDTSAGKINSVLPDWIDIGGKVTSFIILPISINKTLFAIITGTVAERSIDLHEGDLRYLRLIRNHLATLKEMIDDNSITAI